MFDVANSGTRESFFLYNKFKINIVGIVGYYLNEELEE